MSQVLNIDACNNKTHTKKHQKEPNNYVYNNQTITTFFIRHNTTNYKAKTRETMKAPREVRTNSKSDLIHFN